MNKSKSILSSNNKCDQDYYVKYRQDHVYVIRDNKLKYDIEVMIGKWTFYCAFHDTRNSKHVCEHIKFIEMWDGNIKEAK
ncbi:MAG: hypothetical protein P0116_16165 [Candidatus Nitrosocosmicus sp.]|nr:hypothetical protein [Candidatus Nitrosocosmicus sp.]